MTRKKPVSVELISGVGVIPEHPFELSESEAKAFEATYRRFTHLRNEQVEDVARYSQLSVLVRSLSRRVSKNGASVPTRSGGVKRSPDAIALSDAESALRSLSRSLALDEDSQRRKGISFASHEDSVWVELSRRRGERRGLSGKELDEFISQELKRMGLI